jgi:hypothetical protein
MQTTTFTQDLQEMMSGWNKIVAAARVQFPAASDEELYQIAKSAMNHALTQK